MSEKKLDASMQKLVYKKYGLSEVLESMIKTCGDDLMIYSPATYAFLLLAQDAYGKNHECSLKIDHEGNG